MNIDLKSNNKNILTAIDIDNSQKNINSIVDDKIKHWLRARLREEIKVKQLELLGELPEEQQKDKAIRKSIVPDEWIAQKTKEIQDDQQTKIQREYFRQETLKTHENYGLLRSTLYGLNEMNEFSVEIERYKFQTIENFLTVPELLKLSGGHNDLFESIIKNRQHSIQEYIDSYHNKKLPIGNLSQEDIVKNLNTLYTIQKDIDDIDLYNMFDLEDNLGMSNKLADILFYSVANNQEFDNIIDTRNNLNNGYQNLIKSSVISNKQLGLFLLTSFSTERQSFISNNSVSCLRTMWVNNETNSSLYSTRTIGELLLEITNPEYKLVPKENKQQIYMTYNGTRPSKSDYYLWNGLQVFDIDLKKWLQGVPGANIDYLKKCLFDILKDFHWFLWIVKSASGNGLHIYTKVTPPHHVFIKAEDNNYLSMYWYYLNYLQKSSIIYDALFRLHGNPSYNIDFGTFIKKTENLEDQLIAGQKIDPIWELELLDNTVARITSGIRLTYDAQPFINPNFMDLHIALGYCQTLAGWNSQLNHLRTILRKTKINTQLHQRIESLTVKNLDEYLAEQGKSQQIDLSKFVTGGGDISNVTPIPRNQINYVTRYNVVNTLAAIYGKDAIDLAHLLLRSEECDNVNEINAFYSTALNNNKEPTKIGLDILKRFNVIKEVKEELAKETDNKFKNHLKRSIESTVTNNPIKFDIDLKEKEYLSDYSDYLLEHIVSERINLVFSPPGSGKTEYVKRLANSGKRILLVLPYISVITNKIIYDTEIKEQFDMYYGSIDTKNMVYGRNAVMTFDKFSRLNFEKISKMYDYIMVDESHLLFISSYRIDTTSAAVRKLKQLFYISANDPFAAKLCLFTGTVTGEQFIFDNLNMITVSKKSLEKTMQFIICNDSLSCVTAMAWKTVDLIKSGYKVLIPTNKGDIYSEKCIGMIEYMLDRPVKYGYYKRSNSEQEICRLINQHNTVGDYEIIFCSNYLSVGVDINDGGGPVGTLSPDVKFASVYWGDYAGYEIEQFNARIRKTGIKSYFCIQTQQSNGEINFELLEEPNLVLRSTEEEAQNYFDDKQIAAAKQEFIAEYDPVLRRITTPGFSNLFGKIQFDLENYELTMFETKFSECMQHPVKVARELSKYGYEISVDVDFTELSIGQQEELKKIGIESAKNEKLRKHDLLVNTFVELIEKNTYTNDNGLNFDNVIDYISENLDTVIEDREATEYVTINFDLFATPVEVIVKSREALEKMIKDARFLVKKYSQEKCITTIMQYVDEAGILKQKNFKRAIQLLKIIDAANGNELSIPISYALNSIYQFLDKFETTPNYRISHQTYKAQLDQWTNEYIDNLGIKVNTSYGYDKIKDSIIELLSDVAIRHSTKDGIRYTYNKVPDADNNQLLRGKSIDKMIERMFKINGELNENNRLYNKVKERHITLVQQPF